MRRIYTDTCDFRAPFKFVPFAGLGAEIPDPGSTWPAGRAYFDVSQFRAPYNQGYYQSGALRGLGALGAAVPVSAVKLPGGAGAIPIAALPPEVQAYVQSGRPMATWKRDLGAATSQIPRLAYGAVGLLALYAAYRSYKLYKQAHP